jgi:KDO2-lipid IV(A) lauroyltransferase
MKLQTFLNSHAGIGIGLSLSKAFPTRFGYRVANWLADLISARRNNPMVRAVRANQWVVSQERADSRTLDWLVCSTYRSSARSLFEFWHYFQSPEKIMRMVKFDDSFERMAAKATRGETGTIMVTPHMSNFDLVGRAVVLHGVPLHILSYPQPPGGYRWQNMLREMPGMRVTPMSIEALRQASETLRTNGAVITGVDRPLPEMMEAKYQPVFFHRRAPLPVFHIRLALKHDLPIHVVGAIFDKIDGCYHIWASEPLVMDRHPDLIEEMERNAEKVLAVIAAQIRRAPEQWAMFYPVWPETLALVP